MPGVAPAASVTTIVSAMAREIARTKLAAMPGRPAGTTIRVTTSYGVAPTPYAASRRASGTALSASSERDDTIGRIMMPTTMAALAALKTPADGKNDLRIGVTRITAK